MNITAPPMEEAKSYTARMTARRRLSAHTFEITMEYPDSFRFVAGHSIRIHYQDTYRHYSMVNDPDSRQLVLCVRLVQNGLLSPVLADCNMGTSFTISGPYGYFRFNPSPRHPVFVASGTGIAPFASMAHAGVEGFTLIHGVRYGEELYYRNQIESAAKAYVPCITQPSGHDSAIRESFHGRVTDYISRYLSPASYDFYLCGRREMLRDVTHLVDDRFPGSLVYTEIFF
ncbi:MAG: hypothetical protein HKM93_19055 [Desulfobacteraceae bacterium]|nr:hypothetical protein [Desulfobacteraceae bacterium]